jgi:type III pantothenate kinase
MNLLAIDIGNSNTVLGRFNGKKLVRTWRTPSDSKSLSRLKLPDADRVVVSSVVPKLNAAVRKIAKRISGKTPLFIHRKMRMPIRIKVKNPQELGADRIVDVVAAYSRWKKPLIVIDFGTATTFDIVTARGDYVGGAISPGIGIANDALALRCAKLPKVLLGKPKRATAKTTKEAIQSGVFYGYIGLVEGMIARFKKEMRGKPLVVATGGLAPLISKATKMIDKVEPNLTLQGLQILYAANRKPI